MSTDGMALLRVVEEEQWPNNGDSLSSLIYRAECLWGARKRKPAEDSICRSLGLSIYRSRNEIKLNSRRI